MKMEISKSSGVRYDMDNQKSCFTKLECPENYACARQGRQLRGKCIPGWYGICHAWAPVSLLEPEPRCPVEKNGVTFRVLDMKALITQL